jgi:hypothetical protein
VGEVCTAAAARELFEATAAGGGGMTNFEGDEGGRPPMDPENEPADIEVLPSKQ